MLQPLLLVVALVVLYYVIRTAVTHGMLDADDIRRAREREAHFNDVMQDGAPPETPTP